MQVDQAPPVDCPWLCGRSAEPALPFLAARSKPVVLIVSADAEVAAMGRALEEAGVTAIITSRQQNSWQLHNQTRPNLVLLDAGIDQEDRFDLCRMLQLDPHGWCAPVIMISRRQDIPAKVRALECGAVDYLTKPLAMAEVVARVKTHLRLQHTQEALSEAHARTLQLLAGAQQFCMPHPEQLPKAHFETAFQQVHQAGGDFYDVVELGDEKFDYVVADASGHDLSASYWTLSLKTLLAEYSTLLFSPVDALYLMNRALIRLLPDEVFFTTAYLRVDRAAGRVLLLSAAHPPLIYLPAGKKEARLVELPSDVLGCFNDASFGRMEMEVNQGDRLFLFSDGLIECCGPGNAGLTKLQENLPRLGDRSLRELVANVFAEQLRGCPPQDDALLMGVEI